MATLELECPGCSALLELDAGFAGGVCRCSSCGTLMTVPSDSEQGAQALHRPARPDRPARPGEPAPPQTWVTDSGQSIELSEAQIVTARRRRSVIRSLTTLVFLGVLLLVAAAAAWVFFAFMAGRNEGLAPDQVVTETLGYDPQTNPYTLESPNVLGLPLTEPTAVVVEASRGSRNWLAAVNVALQRGLSRMSPTPVMLIYAAADGPSAFHDQPQPTRSLAQHEMAAFQDRFDARGGADVSAAVEWALHTGVKHLVLILPREVDPAQFDAIADQLGEDVSLDLIHLNGRDAAARTLAEQTGGRYIPLSDAQLADWYRAAR